MDKSALATYINNLNNEYEPLKKSLTPDVTKTVETIYLEKAGLGKVTKTVISKHPTIHNEAANRITAKLMNGIKNHPMRYAGYLILVLSLITGSIIVGKLQIGKKGESAIKQFSTIAKSVISKEPKTAVFEISTTPKDSIITVNIDGNKSQHKSPVKLDNIDISEKEQNISVNISHKGYLSEKREVLLSKNHPKESLNIALKEILYGRLEVFAKPWGYVNVSGIVNKKSSPFRSNKISKRLAKRIWRAVYMM